MGNQSTITGLPTDLADLLGVPRRPEKGNAAPAGPRNGVETAAGIENRHLPYIADLAAIPAPSMLDRQIPLSRFADAKAQSLRPESLSMRQLADVIVRTSAPAKAALPLLKLATFGDRRTEKGALRHDGNAAKGGCDTSALRQKHRPSKVRAEVAATDVTRSEAPPAPEVLVPKEGPQLLVRAAPPGQPFPVDALGPLAAAVRTVQGLTLAPIEIPAASALAVAALAVQGLANVETLGGPRPTSLYLTTVALSGERKSSCDAYLMAPLREIEEAEGFDYRAEMAEWIKDRLLWKDEQERLRAEIKKATGKDKAAAQKAFQDLAEPKRPMSRNRTVSEPTFEGLTRLFVEGLPTLGLFSDEGGQFFGGNAMNSDNGQKTQAGLNDLWQGNTIRRTRQGDGSIALAGRRLSIHLMAQTKVFRDFLNASGATETGFLPRFLISAPASTIGTRLQDRQRPDDGALEAYNHQLFKVLKRPLPMDPDTHALKPALLVLSQGARQVLVAFADAIEVLQAPGKELSQVTGFASKAAEQAARIAGVLTMFEEPDAFEISCAAMANGIKLAQFYLSEAVRLNESANANKDIDQAESLRRWLLEEWGDDVIVPSEAVQFGPNNLRNRAVIKKALAILVEAGWLMRLPEGHEVRDRARKEAYQIVRHGDVV